MYEMSPTKRNKQLGRRGERGGRNIREFPET
jgi:hypothetical protein